MDRKDFYFRQKVKEDELDAAFDGAENSIKDIITEYGIGRDANNSSQFGGIVRGLTVTHTAGLNVAVAPGAAYDEDGNLAKLDTATSVTLTNIGNTSTGAGGTPSGGSALPASGYNTYVSLFIAWDRALEDLTPDGLNNDVYFTQPDSFYFHVKKGSDELIGVVPTKPLAEEGMHLLADINIENVSGTSAITAVDLTRKEVFFNVTATGSPELAIKYGGDSTAGALRRILKDLLEYLNDHLGGGATSHLADAVLFSPNPGTTWEDGTPGATGLANNVLEAIQGIVTDLKANTATTGARRIGAPAVAGSLAVISAPADLTEGSIEEQLAELLDAVNRRVLRGGDSGIGGNLSPAVIGYDLGSSSYRWDAFLRDVDITALTSDLLPSGDGTKSLGSNSYRFNSVHKELNLRNTGALINIDDMATIKKDTTGGAFLSLTVEGTGVHGVKMGSETNSDNELYARFPADTTELISVADTFSIGTDTGNDKIELFNAGGMQVNLSDDSNIICTGDFTTAGNNVTLNATTDVTLAGTDIDIVGNTNFSASGNIGFSAEITDEVIVIAPKLALRFLNPAAPDVIDLPRFVDETGWRVNASQNLAFLIDSIPHKAKISNIRIALKSLANNSPTVLNVAWSFRTFPFYIADPADTTSANSTERYSHTTGPAALEDQKWHSVSFDTSTGGLTPIYRDQEVVYLVLTPSKDVYISPCLELTVNYQNFSRFPSLAVV